MDIAFILDRAYETQHFGFHPRTFIDGIYNIFYENLHNGMQFLSEYLVTEKGHVVSPEIIKANSEYLFQKLVKTIDQAIDKLEAYTDRNILCIPDSVVLPEDKVHLNRRFSEKDEKDLDKNIGEMKQKIIMEMVRKSVLKTKIAEQKVVKQELLFLQEKLQDLSCVINEGDLTAETLSSIVNGCNEILSTVKNFQLKKKSV